MKYLGLFVAAMLFLGLTATAEAAGTCTPIYGGGPTCTNNGLSIQKKVLNPQTNLFVHDLGKNDPHYNGNDTITFQITITNNNSQDLTNITIQDNFPQSLTFRDGQGTFNAGNRTLTIKVPKLVAHHSQVFTFRATVVSQDKFTDPSKVFCLTNGVVAVPSNGQLAQDSSQFCLERLTSSPSTGPEALSLLTLLPLAGVGFKLRSLAK